MANNYASVIDIVADQSTDWRAIGIEAAKIAPSVIMSAARRVKEGPWQEAAMPFIKDGQKIEAIKVCRSITGMSLSEAKDAVERLM